MRIDPAESPDADPPWLRAAWGRARLRFDGLGAPGRLALILGLLAVVGAIAFLAALEPTPARRWLYPERTFTPGDAARVVQRLALKGIAAQAVGGGIEVPAEDLAAAWAEVEKAGLEPLSARQLRDRDPDPGFLLTPDQLASREQRDVERRVEATLREIDPALSATVAIRREPRRGLNRAGTLGVTVELALDPDRPIPPDLGHRVRNKVQAYLEPDKLTLLDRKGTILYSSEDPTLGRLTMLQARADALRAELRDGLSWIEGVRVGVTTEPAPEPVAAPEPAVAEPPPIIRPNEPIAAAPGPPDPAGPAPAPGPEPDPLRPAGRATVTILVPSSYYRRIALPGGDGPPSSADLQRLVAETETSIRRVVASIVPADELGGVTIDRIFSPPTERPGAGPSVAGAGGVARLPTWWPSAAVAAVAGAAVLVVAGSRLRAGGQSPRRPDPTPGRRGRFDVGVDEDAGPIERVRALIRQDPAAAAGVLRGWIGPGGTDA